ncbi:MAG: RNA polymerase sigma factor [Flavobacteriales bacterium]
MHFDAATLKRLQQQDNKTVKEWYCFTFASLMRQAAKYYPHTNDQLTVVHNAQLKALKHIEKFAPGTSMEAWLAVILRNELIDSYRRKQRWAFRPFTALEEPVFEENFDLQIDHELENQKVTQLLDLLTDKTRFVFSLFAFEELKPREIAKLLSMNVQTVHWHLKTAKVTLKKHLDHE